jgi:glycosyltransferase involved in cell wall biosynthesis
MALECFSALRKKYGRIYFEVAGSGTYEAQIYRAIQSYHDSNISFKGWIAPDKMPEYLSGIDVGLFPVKKNNKFNNAKSPVKLFEYMATSRPVVASGIGEAKYIIKDGVDGFLAQTKEDFILKMQALIDNKELTAKLGLNARKRIEENYSLKVLGEKLAGILSQA